MIQFSLKNSEGKTREITSPSSYYELPLDKFLRIEAEGKQDVLKLFCILADVETEIAENSKDKKLERAIWEVVSFLAKPFDFTKLEMPTVLEF